MILSAIAAMSRNRAVGKNNGLPWNIPEDFKYFKTKTMNHVMIMGRKTFDSLGKPLPGRPHIVITRNTEWKHEGVIVVQTMEQALLEARKFVLDKKFPEEVFVIGGAEIWKIFMPRLDRIYLTEIHADFAGDTFFPDFSANDFHEIAREARPGPPAFDFVVYQNNQRQ